MKIVIRVTKEDVKRAHISNFDPERHSGWNILVQHPIAYATRRALSEVLGETNTDIGIHVWTNRLEVRNRKMKTPIQHVLFPEEVVATVRHYRKTGELEPFTITLDLPV